MRIGGWVRARVDSDMERQEVLEKAGWQFYRIRYSDWLERSEAREELHASDSSGSFGLILVKGAGGVGGFFIALHHVQQTGKGHRNWRWGENFSTLVR